MLKKTDLFSLSDSDLRKWAAANYRTAIDEIVEALSRSTRSTPRAEAILSSMLDAAVRLRKGDGRKALDEALSTLHQLSGTKAHLVLSGAVDMSLDDRTVAYGKFVSARKAPGSWFSALRGCDSIRPWERRPVWLRPYPRRPELRSPITWVVPGKQSDLTVLCCANDAYFVRFAKTFLASLAESETPVHFHVVNWSKECDSLLKSFDRRGGISVTRETYPFPDDRTYFATVRMLRAHDFLRTLGPLYISDIDNIFTRKPEDVRPHWSGAEVAVMYTKWSGWIPWLSINAGHIFLNDTIRGVETAMLMANYVDHLFKPDSKLSWYFDQLLLEEVCMFTGAKVVGITPRDRPAVGRPAADASPDRQLLEA
jgi:hypothetical protein